MNSHPSDESQASTATFQLDSGQGWESQAWTDLETEAFLSLREERPSWTDEEISRQLNLLFYDPGPGELVRAGNKAELTNGVPASLDRDLDGIGTSIVTYAGPKTAVSGQSARSFKKRVFSAEGCARHIEWLRSQNPERFKSRVDGAALPSVQRPKKVPHLDLTERLAQDLKVQLCDRCYNLNLGALHDQHSRRFADQEHLDDDDYEPHHLLNSTLRELNMTAVECVCCKFIFDAIQQTVQKAVNANPNVSRGADPHDQPFELFLKRNGLSKQDELIAGFGNEARHFGDPRLRVVHLDDWRPSFPELAGDVPPLTIAQSVPTLPDLAYIRGRIGYWQYICNSRHKHCAKLHDRSLPTRLLYVRNNEGGIVKLHDRFQHHSSYIALSYAWGGKDQYRLTAETQEVLKAGVGPETFAKTIQDAIAITRELGVDYLWIDALCIRQDSYVDWDEQSAKMGQIYENACLTLIASRASSVDEGFLEPTLPSMACCGFAEVLGSRKPVYLTKPAGKWTAGRYDDVDPLSLRAWALQEECLSSRKVMFTSRQMVWLCRSARWVEMQRDCGDSKATITLSTLDFKFNFHNSWVEVVKRHASRRLTVRSDRLVSLSGIAQLVAKITGYRYLAGHWLAPGLLVSLFWACDGSQRDSEARDPKATEYLAPSWSWASVNGPVRIHRFSPSNQIGRIEDCSITLKGANPYGEVTAGYIDIYAPILSTTFGRVRSACGAACGANIARCRPETVGSIFDGYLMGPKPKLSSYFDFDNPKDDANLDLICLVFKDDTGHNSTFGISGLMVTPARENTFRRVGTFARVPDTKDGVRNTEFKVFRIV